jgi:hypothetical protein
MRAQHGEQRLQIGVDSYRRHLLLFRCAIEPSIRIEYVSILAPELLVSNRYEHIVRKGYVETPTGCTLQLTQ